MNDSKVAAITLPKEFYKDEYSYFVALKIIKEGCFYVGDNDYFLVQSERDRPAWIWTEDNFEPSKVGEINGLISKLICGQDGIKIVCKRALFDLLTDFCEPKAVFDMGVLYCTEAVMPKKISGKPIKATPSDIEVLSRFIYMEAEEAGSSITAEDSLKRAEDLISLGKTYLLKNDSGKPVSMLTYSVIDNLAKINGVFTSPEERNKGYCANLVYSVTQSLLSQNITPMLYTDYNYLPSNRAYMNIGYKSAGVLKSFVYRSKIG